jgi:hypothetical protein
MTQPVWGDGDHNLDIGNDENELPLLSMDVLYVIFGILQLSPLELAPYRRCSRPMAAMVGRLATRFTANHLPLGSQLQDGDDGGEEDGGGGRSRVVWVAGITSTFPFLEALQLSKVVLGPLDADTLRLPPRHASVGPSWRLKEVDLHACIGVTDSLVQALAQGCPHLASVTLGGSVRRWFATLNVLLENISDCFTSFFATSSLLHSPSHTLSLSPDNFIYMCIDLYWLAGWHRANNRSDMEST